MQPHPFKVVIPARFASTRLPGKPLRLLAGKPIVQHVYERASKCGAEQVLIATDDERIRKTAEGFGASVCMTSAAHPTGTDRIAEVVRTLGWRDETIVVNVQGDEPLINPALVRQVAGDLAAHPTAGIATLAMPVQATAELFDPSVVKIVLDKDGFALYFSRAPIPWSRDAFVKSKAELPAANPYLRHVGLYAYRAAFLGRYSKLEASAAEKAESLEQLRALSNGIRIFVGVTSETSGPGVDTEEDLQKLEAMLKRTGA